MRNLMRAVAVALAAAASASAAQPAIPFDPQKLVEDMSAPEYLGGGYVMDVGVETSTNFLLGVPLLYDNWSVNTLYLAGRVNVARIAIADENGIARSVSALPGGTIDVPGVPTPVTTYDFSGQGLNKPFEMMLLLGDGVLATSVFRLGPRPSVKNGGYQFSSGAQFSDVDHDPIGEHLVSQPWIDDPVPQSFDRPLFYGFSFDVIQPAIPGDFNTDGRVDISDFGVLKDNFGSGTTLAQGDANGDAKVDISDFGILKSNFGKSGAAAVPEPETWLLAIYLTATFCFRSRPRSSSRSSRA